VCLAGPKDVNILTEGTENEINVLMYREDILKINENLVILARIFFV
jgi:hypothetical protein